MKTLKYQLLVLLLPALIVLLCGELWLDYRALAVAANSAYDRSLLGAIKAIDVNTSTSGGGLNMKLPYAMLEFFQLTANGKVFYRVATEDGLVTLGNADLPPHQVVLQTDVPYFYDAKYFGEQIRVGAYARRLSKPLYGAQPQRIVIQVAETIESRATFTWDILRQAAALDMLLVLLIALVMTAGIVIALRPLERLHHEIKDRAQDDLTPIDPTRVPLEVRPLVAAINHHVERFDKQTRNQRQFLDDASHQLRTPLTVLRTQVEYALRELDLPRIHEALKAMQGSVGRATRLVNQLLTLAFANNKNSLTEPMRRINLSCLSEEVARMFLPEASRKAQDFGFVADESVFVMGIESLLHDAIGNLVDNAIRYVPNGGHITLIVDSCGMMARVMITDNGPGMTLDERASAGERFRRGKGGQSSGAGLGLAITKTIIEKHHGKLEISDGPDRIGLSVCVILPLCPDCLQHVENDRPYV
ncbi:MAG TPA: sensor histidine kinase [Burkholderiaceae bacterium]